MIFGVKKAPSSCLAYLSYGRFKTSLIFYYFPSGIFFLLRLTYLFFWLSMVEFFLTGEVIICYILGKFFTKFNLLHGG